MTFSVEQHPPLPAGNLALKDAQRLVGQLAPDGCIRSLKPDPFLNVDEMSGSEDRNDAIFSRKISSRDSGNSSATEFSDTTNDEEYDTSEVDASTMVARGRYGGYLSKEDQTWNEKQFERHYEGVKGGRSLEKKSEIKMERRQSFSVKLEKTDKTGRYLLTSDDPELRELLAIITERAAGDGRKGRAKFSDLIFTRQFTAFDRQNPTSAASPFHGFFTLFWLGVFIFILKVAGDNWRTYGSAFGKNEILHIMFSREVMALGLTDGVMCAGTVMGLILQKTVAKGWIRWNGSGWVIQNVATRFTMATVSPCRPVAENRNYKRIAIPDTSRSVSDTYLRKDTLLTKSRQLRERETPGPSPTTAVTTGSFPVVDLTSVNDLTHRRLSSSHKNLSDLKQEQVELSKIASAIDSGIPLNTAQISSFAKIVDQEIEALTLELNGKCSSTENHYPKNLTLRNWAEYVVLPTLVYELEYPRQERISWSYVAEKTAATFGTVGVMIVVSQAYIYPVVMHTVEMRDQGWTLQQRLEEFPWILSDLIFPFMMEYLLAFYVIWECV
ncbi:hypothetical protein GP486_000723, partial [Trichoglossum hirsutum]